MSYGAQALQPSCTGKRVQESSLLLQGSQDLGCHSILMGDVHKKNLPMNSGSSSTIAVHSRTRARNLTHNAKTEPLEERITSMVYEAGDKNGEQNGM